MSNLRRAVISLIIAFLLFTLLPLPGRTDDWEDGETAYTVTLADGSALFEIGGAVYAGDQYIAADNRLYQVTAVDERRRTAQAEPQGEEEMPDVSWLSRDEALAVYAATQKKLVALYATHSDESYVPSDGTASSPQRGGIFDVAEGLQAALEAKGVDVVLDESTHHPHDAGAYRRSRQTATKLAQRQPDALIDVHRDGIPSAAQYNDTIDGEQVTKVRLLVGRSNQNGAANRDFAKQIKAVADKAYPGLVKDIFIGKGSYNQELLPHAILLEFGTHTTSKERAVRSTTMMADVLDKALYGQVSSAAKDTSQGAGNQAAEGQGAQQSNAGSGSGIIWLLVIAAVGILAFAFLSTGTGKAMREKLMRNTSEITGGLLGKKPPDKK
ncbi:MAG: stage II sporulation protein P [Oscillospiraceae bacterium]|jgi:stage II sporulation protein P|nr:stage II sporulation protein P [Oscillospiraceae bacterium]